MANELVLPAFLQALVAKQDSTTVAKFLPAVKSNDLPARVSIGDGDFTIIEEDGESTELQTKYMDCIIVAVADRPSRIYYAEKFDPKNPQKGPPTCFSDNGVGASINASEPQSTSCKTCQWAVWGSAQSLSGKGKPACQEGQKLAVLYEDKLYQLRLPPMSVKTWKTYVLYLEKMLRDRGITLVPSNVITRIEFASTGVLKFTPNNLITDEINAQIQGLDQEEIDQLLSKRDVVWTGPNSGTLSSTFTAQPSSVPESSPLSTLSEPVIDAPKRRGRPPNSETTFAPAAAPKSVVSFLDQAMGRK